MGDRVEALYTEDGLWYAARIDAIEADIERYILTFTDYGNEQVTCEEDVRPTVADMMAEREKELAPAVEVELLKKKKRRQSLLLAHPELVKKDKKKSSTSGEGSEIEAPDEKSNADTDGSTSVEPSKADRDSAAAELEKLMKNPGALSNEERKALLLMQARRLSVGGDADRTYIKIDTDAPPSTGPPQASPLAAEPKAHSDRYLEHLRKGDKKFGRSRSSSQVEMKAKHASQGSVSTGIFGDMESLVNQARTRAESDSSILGQDSPSPSLERKVWADNAMLRKVV